MNTKSRVRLVPLEDEHITRYLPLSADPVLVDTMGWKPFAHNERERFIQHVESITAPHIPSGHVITFSVIHVASNIPAGYLSLKGVRENGTEAEIGLAIVEKDYRGHGSGTEALTQAATCAFDALGLSMLVLTVLPDNTAAIRSYEKVGFVRTDLLKNSWQLHDGGMTDMWVMRLYRPGAKKKPPGCDTSHPGGYYNCLCH